MPKRNVDATVSGKLIQCYILILVILDKNTKFKKAKDFFTVHLSFNLFLFYCPTVGGVDILDKGCRLWSCQVGGGSWA